MWEYFLGSLSLISDVFKEFYGVSSMKKVQKNFGMRKFCVASLSILKWKYLSNVEIYDILFYLSKTF